MAANELNLKVDQRTSREVTVFGDDLPWGLENSITFLSIQDKTKPKVWCMVVPGSNWDIPTNILAQGPGHQFEVTVQSGKRSFGGNGFEVEATGMVEFRAGHWLGNF